MIIPNKLNRFNESTLSKIPIILDELSNQKYSIEQLYKNTLDDFDGIDEFLLTLDVLYILNAIEVDFHKGVINYVKGNS